MITKFFLLLLFKLAPITNRGLIRTLERVPFWMLIRVPPKTKHFVFQKKIMKAKENPGTILIPLLHKKCPYSEIFWFVFSRIWTEYRYLQCKSLHSGRMRENTYQKNSIMEALNYWKHSMNGFNIALWYNEDIIE